jgi:hypothetical protein
MQAPTSLAASDMVLQLCDRIVELMQCEDPKDLRAIVNALSAAVTAFPSLLPVYDIGVDCIGRKCGDTGLLTPGEAGVCKAVHRALTATRPADGTCTCGCMFILWAIVCLACMHPDVVYGNAVLFPLQSYAPEPGQADMPGWAGIFTPRAGFLSGLCVQVPLLCLRRATRTPPAAARPPPCYSLLRRAMWR